MYDAANIFADKFYLPYGMKLKRDKKLAVMTVHRADTTSDPRSYDVISFCDDFAREYQIVFPVHEHKK